MAEPGPEHLLIFARAPTPGRAKTRLVPPLTPEGAAALHAAFVRDVVARHRRPGRRLTLWRAGEPDHPFWAALAAAYPGLDFADQATGDLGVRMAEALGTTLAAAPSARVVIVGTDSPTLPPAVVDAAFAALARAPVVLGPACDGGYHLVGAVREVPPIFSGPAWGGPAVLCQTLERLHQADRRPALMDFWYDVDRPADLALLRAHLRAAGHTLAPHTAACLATLEDA